MQLSKNWLELVKVARDLGTRGVKLWNAMVMVAAVDMKADGSKALNAEGQKKLKEEFASHEKAEKERSEYNLLTVGAYRSAKSVISAANKFGVPLLEKGAPRGKTEVEKAIRDLRQPEPAIKSIARALSTIEGKIEGVTNKTDAITLHQLWKQVATKVEAAVADLTAEQKSKKAA